MRVTLSKSKNAEQVYITKAYRNDAGKSTSRIFKQLGTMAELLPAHDNDRDKVLAWAKEQAHILTEEEKKNELKVTATFSENKQIRIGEQASFHGGYLFLQKICSELGIPAICAKIAEKHSFRYDLSEILCGLIYARILSPSSKLSSYGYLQTLIEKPSFSLQDVYRALDILHQESDTIQAELYRRSRAKQNSTILYYDCTNFFFEIEEEDDFRKYGKSKEHRPNPIVQFGLFLDGNGLPLAFTMFPGNENEQPSLIPLEERIMKDYALSKFILCTDAGLASAANRRFNTHGDRSFIVRQSLKQLKEHLRNWSLDPSGWYLNGDSRIYDLRKIDEEKHRNDVFYKERWINENGLEQRLIVTFSLKYKYYQREIRQRQVERAEKIVKDKRNRRTRNPNSPERFVQEVQLTLDGEIAEFTQKDLDEDKIRDEEQYDGFTAVCTNLDGNTAEILKVNHCRWEIEESFRIMKTEFRARPVYLRREERIRAHFLTCFLSLMVFRCLEKKLGEQYSVEEIRETLQRMDFYRVKGMGYLPTYTRSPITDALHDAMGFRTDNEIVLEKNMKKILKETKTS